MELGKHLVRELEFEDSFDTLGRWMSHHVAELIHQAENGSTQQERENAERKAVDVILRIWEHKTALPGKAYPLASYKDILEVIQHLEPSNNPFRKHNFGEDKDGMLVSRLFDCLTHLTIVLLLRKLTTLESAEVNSVVRKHLDETEQETLISIQYWLELFKSENSKLVQVNDGRRKRKKPDTNLASIALQLIGQTNSVLADLQKSLESSGYSMNSQKLFKTKKSQNQKSL